MTQILEDRIVALLKNGPKTGPSLVADLANTRTKEAVYKALRRLRTQEVVLRENRAFRLNSLWLVRQERFFREALGLRAKQPSFARFSDGDSVSYTFKTLTLLDAHWGDIELELASLTPQDQPIIMYCPHYWFPLVREKTESAIIKALVAGKHDVFLISGGVSLLDKFVRKTAESWGAEYALLPNARIPRRTYLNSFGDFVVEVRLDKGVSTQIDRWYDEYASYDFLARKAFAGLTQGAQRHSLRVAKHPKKAAAIRWQFEKLFR